MVEAAEINADDEAGTKRRSRHLRVPVTTEEGRTIEALAEHVGLPIAAYLRLVGIGYQPRSMIDVEQARALVRVNGDLGRLGGLLKLWLTDDAKLAELKPDRVPEIIRGLLKRIEANQEQMDGIIKAVLRSRQSYRD
jgi:hypothetical protein